MADNDNIVVSIKPSKGHDSALLVFKGADGEAIKAHLVSFFGLDPVTVAGQAPIDVFQDVERALHGGGPPEPAQTTTRVYTPQPAAEPAEANVEPPSTVSEAEGVANVEKALGATEVPAEEVKPEPAPAAPQGPTVESVIEEIKATATPADIGKLWVKRKAFWTDPAVDAAARKRSEELK